jgi:hypothetical protein
VRFFRRPRIAIHCSGAQPLGRSHCSPLATPLVAVGARNHFRHVPAMARCDGAAPFALARNVRVEVALGAAILVATAVLGVLPMPHVHHP